MSDLKNYWVGLNMVKGVGAVRLRSLLDAFGNAQSAWLAPSESLLAAGLPGKIIDNRVRLRVSISIDEVWERIQAKGIRVLIWDDEDYPVRLRKISNAPPVLCLRGGLETDDEWAVAIVGTRRVTSYGRQVGGMYYTVIRETGGEYIIRKDTDAK